MKNLTTTLAGALLALSLTTPAALAQDTAIKVAVLPQINTLPLRIGVERGFFAARGITPEFVEVPMTSASASAVVSGAVQFGVVDLPTGAAAQEKGLPLKWVANLFTSPADARDPFFETYAVKDSGVSTWADVNGKQLRIGCRNCLQHILLQNAIDAEGGDSKTVEFMVMNEADAIAAVEQGHLKVMTVSINGRAHAARLGMTLIGDASALLGPQIPVTPFVVNSAWAASNPKLVQGFIDAVNDSLDFVKENPDEARAKLAEYYPLQVRGVTDFSSYPLPHWEACLNMVSIQSALDVAARYGVLTKPVVAGDLFYQDQGVQIRPCS